ncbi:MAG: outer membrane lipoprotein-sorting protein [Bacteroidetes bacterium]|nr:outer membrane lipoprotein-sorting protein [Bacteroidota bacterium]
MKKIALLLFAAAAFISVQAQTADDVINKYIEAMGGKEKLATLKTVKMTGGMSAQGMDIPMVLTKSHMVGIRLDIELMGQSYFQIANATKGQVYMPGMSEAQDMEEDMYKSFSSQMDVHGGLVNYKEKGSTVELVGTEKVDGAEAYNIKLTNKGGKVINYYIDKTTNRIVKSASEMNGEKVETSFSDYKQTPEGYWFP